MNWMAQNVGVVAINSSKLRKIIYANFVFNYVCGEIFKIIYGITKK